MSLSELRRYAQGRATQAWLLAWCAAATVLIVTASNPIVLPVQFLEGQPTRWTPLWELIPSLLGAATGGLIAPRLGSWERRSVRPVRMMAALFAATTLTLTSALPWIAHFRLPTDARWIDITSNVLAVASLGLITTSLFGRLIGGIIPIASYFAFIAVSHAVPEFAQNLPMSGVVGNTSPHPGFAIPAAVIAVTVWAVTRGQATSARSLSRNE